MEKTLRVLQQHLTADLLLLLFDFVAHQLPAAFYLNAAKPVPKQEHQVCLFKIVLLPIFTETPKRITTFNYLV